MGILQTPLVEPLRLDLKNGSSSCDSSDPWEGNKQSLLFIQLIEGKTRILIRNNPYCDVRLKQGLKSSSRMRQGQCKIC